MNPKEFEEWERNRNAQIGLLHLKFSDIISDIYQKKPKEQDELLMLLFTRLDGNHTDITAPKIVEVVIRCDSKVVWINTEKGCIFRACRIKKLTVDDRRKIHRRKTS